MDKNTPNSFSITANFRPFLFLLFNNEKGRSEMCDKVLGFLFLL